MATLINGCLPCFSEILVGCHGRYETLPSTPRADMNEITVVKLISRLCHNYSSTTIVMLCDTLPLSATDSHQRSVPVLEV